jgi:hypothetical protein
MTSTLPGSSKNSSMAASFSQLARCVVLADGVKTLCRNGNKQLSNHEDTGGAMPLRPQRPSRRKIAEPVTVFGLSHGLFEFRMPPIALQGTRSFS